MSAQLVGREEELQALELFLAATRGEPRALVIEGEAGVGKTSLWEAAIHSAADRGARCLSARPAEAEASFAYAALGDLLRAERDALAALPPRQRHALEVALLLSDQEGESPDAQSVGLGVLGVLERLAAGGPLVVAVDDVQWLDTPSAAVLSFAARRVQEIPLALLLSWRTAGGEAAPLDLDRAAIGDGLERLAVRPLSLGAIQKLVQDRLGFLPPRPALRRLHDLSGGNPFFALELARALRGGALTLEPGERLPVALDELAGARVRALSEGARSCARRGGGRGSAHARARRRGDRRRPGRARRGRARGGHLGPRRPHPLRAPAARVERLRGGRSSGAAPDPLGGGEPCPRLRGARKAPGARRDRARRVRGRGARGGGRPRGVTGRAPGRGRALRARRGAHSGGRRRGPAPPDAAGRLLHVPERRRAPGARAARRGRGRAGAGTRARRRPDQPRTCSLLRRRPSRGRGPVPSGARGSR